ncbi:succinyldiaminopimelate desuccinylase [Pseudonocardia hierapolitana]|uniref:Succinyl-diaminopimelate desuccinylase n=1 Tax=Pseudonocardia hierapolitana TaxID=1128676 RepID=A0A561SNE7_9PSEU|nr:succinyl-diaminopimelate desuccinylase [Pseudonocardia hierapolitana]TWF76379.1 succinyldiaminopimelate desuccinylase [Pseudonocardia hierapolitana]
MRSLDLAGDPVELCAALVDVPSVSGDEGELASALEAALRAQAPHLRVLRSGHAVLARTELGREKRVLLAGHIDTVPIAGNVPSRRDAGLLHGCGTSDMKAGDAVFAHLAAVLPDPRHDLTFVFYDCEEVEAVRNGLGRIEREHRDWLAADLAILGEPTNGAVEAGCQGTLRVDVTVRGRRAHSARSWLGDNAVHKAEAVLHRLATYPAREVDIDGCRFREGLQAVRIAGGVAGNVVPDECVVTVNFRFAPDRDAAAAEKHVREVFDGFEVTLTDLSAGALPGLGEPAAQEFLAATGAVPTAKLGWTDVARFAALGIPALNYGPGDPNLAHTRDEHVEPRKITEAVDVLRRFLA